MKLEKSGSGSNPTLQRNELLTFRELFNSWTHFVLFPANFTTVLVFDFLGASASFLSFLPLMCYAELISRSFCELLIQTFCPHSARDFSSSSTKRRGEKKIDEAVGDAVSFGIRMGQSKNT